MGGGWQGSTMAGVTSLDEGDHGEEHHVLHHGLDSPTGGLAEPRAIDHSLGTAWVSNSACVSSCVSMQQSIHKDGGTGMIGTAISDL